MFYHVDISWNGMSAVLWTLTALAVPLTVGRYVIRYRLRKRFFADDVAHLVAVAGLFVYSGFAQAMFPLATLIFDNPAEEAPVDALLTFRKYQIGVSIGFFVSLWAVKLSFLFFYRLLFWIAPNFRKFWWVCLVFVVVSFWIVIAGILTACGPVSDYYNLAACSRTFQLQKDIFIYLCTFNVASDICLIVLPIWMLAGIKIEMKQKIGLAFLFSVVIVTIILDILRTVDSIYYGIFTDSIVYSTIEVTFTVYLSCLPTYRSILGIERKTDGPIYQPWAFSKSRLTQNKTSAAGSTNASEEAQGDFESLDGRQTE